MGGGFSGGNAGGFREDSAEDTAGEAWTKAMRLLKHFTLNLMFVGFSGSSVMLAQGSAQSESSPFTAKRRTRPSENQRIQNQKEIPPRSFHSPDEAVSAFIDAVSKNDQAALKSVLGSKAQNLLSSGNTKQDQEERREFATVASAKNHVERSAMDGSAAGNPAFIGDQDWPFPIPLVQTRQQWHFDPELGAIEMQARQIGANELDAIEICMGYVNAQQEYAAQNAIR